MPTRPGWPQADPIDLQEALKPGVYGLFGGVVVGTVTIILGFVTGLLPFGRTELHDPCRTADIAALVTDASNAIGSGGATSARCSTNGSRGAGFAEMNIHLERFGPEEHAIDGMRRGCTALAGLGPVSRPTGIGDEACVASEDGRLRIATVLARQDNIQITVRYVTQARTVADAQQVALTAARRVAASP
ncbi:hypothetical protein J4573_25765 [Actinomadura barringtoniae]|uniref:DUF3558 domain-containing protein n=1 Tax=Actinomadura barringtoniae TaxID=1427535 RepID=A0A939PDC1_9ACTN|nr:hypothetical protein [Actinomadura barringtoniae]MBO2450536.1 hypothetical protein [Actinomadura barringtoniae]